VTSEGANPGTICTAPNVWVRSRTSSGRARLRLFCFPYAGAGASLFHSWSQGLGSDVELDPVQLPGREDRLEEPPFIRLTPLVETLGRVLAPYLDRPFALFGHSMGALIAFEFARHLHATGRPSPESVIVSAYRAPHLASRRAPIHQLSDQRFLTELRRLSGTAEEVLQHDELRLLLLPTLHADFAVCETYVHELGAPLDCPIFAVGGQGDPEVSRDELAAWRSHTRGAFSLEMVPGDHLFLRSAGPLVVSSLRRALSHALRD